MSGAFRRLAATLSRVLVCVTAFSVCACSSESEPTPTTEDPCPEITVDRFKELIVVDEAVISDPRASNAAAGPWSFRFVIEELAAASQLDTNTLLMSWLQSFGSDQIINKRTVWKRTKTHANLICPWLKQTPENGCDISCSSCTAKVLDLSKAPFRLSAIVNRMDLRETAKYPGAAGEGRLVFSLTGGPADDPGSPGEEMTVIFEYDLPVAEGHDVAYWASRWHELGSSPAYDEDFRTKLQAVTDSFVRRGTSTSLEGAPALRQVRTNERYLDWVWQQREFLFIGGALTAAPIENTPDRSFNQTEQFRQFLLANEEPIMKGIHVLPPDFEGGASEGDTVWGAPVPEPLRKAFATETCNGCHLSEVSVTDIAFHVSPKRTGIDRLSRFLHNPDDTASDELSRRGLGLKRALCHE